MEVFNQQFYKYEDVCAKLIYGDVFDQLPLIEDEKVDAILTDPPYFLSKGGVTCHSGKMVNVDKGNWDKPKSFTQNYTFTKTWIKEAKRILKPGGSIMITGTHHNIFIVGYVLMELGFIIRNNIVWYKASSPPNLSCKTLTHKYENIIWATKLGKYTFNYQDMKETSGGGDYFKKENSQMIDLWDIGRPKKGEYIFGKHPTQKPLALFNRMVKMVTNTGDLILDPFCGSGVSGVSAITNFRNYIGIDNSEEFLDITKQKLACYL